MQRTNDIPNVLPGSDFDEPAYIQNLIDSYNPDSHSCQRCNKRIWFGGETRCYKRGITWACNGAPKDDFIMVPCMLCRQCGKSEDGSGTENGDYHHAILRGTLIPFSSYTLFFILTVLYEYFNRTTTVAAVCEKWQISTKTLYQWRKRYKDHYEAWTDSLHSLANLEAEARQEHPPQRSCALALFRSLEIVLENLSALVNRFFGTFAFSFLQPNTKSHLRELSGKRRPRIRL